MLNLNVIPPIAYGLSPVVVNLALLSKIRNMGNFAFTWLAKKVSSSILGTFHIIWTANYGFWIYHLS